MSVYHKSAYCPYGFEDCHNKYCIPDACDKMAEYKRHAALEVLVSQEEVLVDRQKKKGARVQTRAGFISQLSNKEK